MIACPECDYQMDEIEVGAETRLLIDRLRLVEIAAKKVTAAWVAVGRCMDEFEPDGQRFCGEYVDALDTAIIVLRGHLGNSQE